MIVLLSEGEHVVEGSWTDSDGDLYENTLGITCSNVSFIGQGKDKTTVHDWNWCVEQKECDGEEFDFDESK